MAGIDITDHDTIINTQDGYPFIVIGKGSYIGSLIVHSSIDMDINSPYLFQVGRYTSIGENLKIINNLDHDYKSVFQGAIVEFADETSDSFRRRRGQNDRYMDQKAMVLIGSDVWIGDDVIIVADATIGDGAVIAAGSVVVGDVPPYTIYGGNPARFIKKRFDDEIAGLLERIQWWNFDREKMLDVKEEMLGDTKSFARKYGELAEYYDNTNILGLTHKGSIPSLIAFLDTETKYNSFGNIMIQFCSTFSDGQAELVLCYDPEDPIEAETAAMITDMIPKFAQGSLFKICQVNSDMEEAAISEADLLIVGRGIKNIRRTSFAYKYGITCISGFDIPIFSSKVLKKINGHNS